MGHDSNRQQALVSQSHRGAVRRSRRARSRHAPEQLLWARIRGLRLGVVFRRQVPLLGRFIADFLAPSQRLVVEIDGGSRQARAG
jgi:very-short-patch-repair endonuclease